MEARLYLNQLTIGSVARDFVRLVEGTRPRPTKEMQEPSKRKAQEILESIEAQDNSAYELDVNIEGKDLIKHMDQGFKDLEIVPYFYRDEAKSQGVGIYPGSYVIISGDPSKTKYRTIKVSFTEQSVRIRDTQDGNRFQLPWDLLEPAPVEDQDTPYWFTSVARKKNQDLQVGDYVRLLGTNQKYELMDIYWDGNVRVRAVGSTESLGLPWRYVSPWKED